VTVIAQPGPMLDGKDTISIAVKILVLAFLEVCVPSFEAFYQADGGSNNENIVASGLDCRLVRQLTTLPTEK